MCVSMRVTKHLIPDKLNKQVVTDSYLYCSVAPVVHLTALNVSHCMVGTAHAGFGVMLSHSFFLGNGMLKF